MGFSLKWNMGWMNDTLRYMRHEPIHRAYHHNELTFSLIYAFTENFSLPLSHDEVVHAKGSLISQRLAICGRSSQTCVCCILHVDNPGKKLLFMGSELAQWHEMELRRRDRLGPIAVGYSPRHQQLIGDLNHLVQREPALHQVDFRGEGFEWLDCMNNHDSIIAYVRKAENPEDFVVVACNFTPIVRHNYRLGVPRADTIPRSSIVIPVSMPRKQCWKHIQARWPIGMATMDVLPR